MLLFHRRARSNEIAAAKHDVTQRYSYRVYGLSLNSHWEFTGLPTDTSQEAPLVTCVPGEIPQNLDDCVSRGARYQSSPGKLLVWLDDVGRFLVSDGRRITIDLSSTVAGSKLRDLVFASPFCAVLQQRGLLPLHCSAILSGGRAVMFLGSSGTGKSTIAAAFWRLGYPILADDMGVVDFIGGKCVLIPGPEDLRLYPDALAHLALQADQQSEGATGYTKVHVSHHNGSPESCVPIAMIYLLDFGNHNEIRIKELEGEEKIRTLLKHAYRREFLKGMEVANPFDGQYEHALGAISVHKVSARKGLVHLPKVVESIVGNIGDRL